ncbi:MAG: sensor histidine kinase [Acidimicrobiia bacterium]
MRLGTRQRPGRNRRTVGIAVGATLLLAALVVGLAFANSIGAGRVADNARSLHWANASLGTAALTRSALVQAATFEELSQLDQVDQVDSDAALTDAQTAVDRLGELQELGADSQSLPYLTHFISPAKATLQALRSGDVGAAKDLIVGDVEASYMDLVDSLQAEQDEIQVAIDANTAAGARVSDFVLFFLTFAIPTAAVLIYRSIAKRQVEQLRHQADLEIETERELGKAKDEFIAGLSHELRTPLTSIYGFAEVLTDSAEDKETTQELAQIIANEAAEMTRMVDDLLTAARLESTGIQIESTLTRVSDIVESAVTPFERAGMSIRRSNSNAVVETDAARLRHVVVNLLSNAAQHGGSNVGVEVSSGDGVVDIEVWDNGPGVPEDKVQNLFDRFVHSGEETLLTGSLGLGLGVASRLSGMLGGKLSYQRFAGKTYFTVTLPAAGEEEAKAEEKPEPVAAIIKALSS